MSKNTIPTVNELLIKACNGRWLHIKPEIAQRIKKAMITHTKLYVKSALEVAQKKLNNSRGTPEDTSILNSYPESLIK